MATLVIACPICLQKIRAPENVVGRQVKCPQCRNGFTALDPAAVPVEPLALVPQKPREQVPVSETTPPASDPLALDASDEGELPEPTLGSSQSLIDYLMFRRMATPVILTGLFYFGLAVILLAGLVGAIMVVAWLFRSGPILLGLVVLLLDFIMIAAVAMLWRVACEIVITLFRILDQVRDINERMSRE